MKLELLKKALEHYVLSADCRDKDRSDVFEAIAECNELAERYEDRNMWKDSVYLVSAGSLSDLLNRMTYDDFGKLARVHGCDVPFDNYAKEVRKWYVSDMTNRSLQLGYDIVHDLWGDNEEYGCNRADGSFDHRHKLTDEHNALLDVCKRYLIAYYVTNCEVLEKSVNDEISAAIADLTKLLEPDKNN